MRTFWSSVLAGTLGAVLSAATIATMGELRPLGLHWILPAEAVIAMSGQCPSGWSQFDGEKGQYLLAPEDDLSRNRDPSPAAELINPEAIGRTGAPKGHQRLVLRAQSAYVILNLCQRR